MPRLIRKFSIWRHFLLVISYITLILKMERRAINNIMMKSLIINNENAHFIYVRSMWLMTLKLTILCTSMLLMTYDLIMVLKD